MPAIPDEAQQPGGEIADVERLAALERPGLLDTTPEQSLDRLTRLAARVLRAPVALLSLVDDDRRLFAGSAGLAPSSPEDAVATTSHAFCLEVAAGGRPVVVEDARAGSAQGAGQPPAGHDIVAYAGVPLITPEGEVVGSFCAFDTRPRAWTSDDVGLLEELAAATMAEIDLRAAATEARDAYQRLAFLVEASTELVASLDYQETLVRVARLTVRDLADWCSVAVVEDDGSLSRLALVHADPALADTAEALRACLPTEPMAVPGIRRVLGSGRPTLLRRPRFEDLWEAREGEPQQELVARLGLTSAMVVPMRARGRTLGTITLVASPGRRPFDEDDLLLAADLAARAALAVDNARLYDAQRTVAHTLQQSLLPPRLPAIPGVDLAATYRAAGEGIEVGGDFYDVFATADGTWGVVMGDVCGKGPDAAALTALARWTIRTAAAERRSPADVLVLLNDAILSQDTEERFCTLSVGRLELLASGARLRIARGGHPPTFVLRADGGVEAAGTPGSLIGVLPEPSLVDDELHLSPGDAIVLVTDGVLEARDDAGRQLGVGGLMGALAGVAGRRATEIVSAVEEVALAHRGQHALDDLAVLALVVTG